MSYIVKQFRCAVMFVNFISHARHFTHYVTKVIFSAFRRLSQPWAIWGLGSAQTKSSKKATRQYYPFLEAVQSTTLSNLIVIKTSLNFQ